MIDNCICRDNPHVREHLKKAGLPIIKYQKDIIKMDGLRAVKRMKPQAVIACWPTVYNPSKIESKTGIDEVKLIKNIDRYYLVGNYHDHKNSKLLNRRDVSCIIHDNIPFMSKTSMKGKDVIFEFSINK